MNKLPSLLTILTFLFLSNSYSFSQTIFQKEVERANLYEVKQIDDSSFVSVGWWNDPLNSNHQYACLVKTNYMGDTLWSKLYGESQDFIAYSLDVTSDNGYILTGSSYPNDSMESKVILIRTDLNGDTLWTKKYGGIGDDNGRYVRQTFDGGFIISGTTTSFVVGPPYVYVLKTDFKGEVEWSRTFGTGALDRTYSICQTADSGFVALCNMPSLTNYGDIVLIKMNSRGDTLWTKSYGGFGPDYGYEMQQTSNNGFAVTGVTTSFSGTCAYLFVTDINGDLLWSKTYGAGDDTMRGNSVFQTSDHGFVICGHTYGFGAATYSPFVIKVNSLGDTIWSKMYTNLDLGTLHSIIQTFDGGYATVGSRNEFMKLDSNGSSGCFEKSITPTITNPPTQQFNNPIWMTIPNTISYSTSIVVRTGVSMNTICSTPINTGVDQLENYTFQIFPNPSSGKFQLTFPDIVINGKIKVYNIFSA
jgi:hypothetical protein